MWRDIPVEPDAETARQWAEDELAKSEYQGGGTNWVQRFLDWLARVIDNLGNNTGGTFGGWGVVAAIAVGLVLVGLIVWIVVGPLRRARRRTLDSDELGDPTLRASELFDSARAAADAGDVDALAALDRLARTPPDDSELRKIAWMARAHAAAVRCAAPGATNARNDLAVLATQVRAAQPEGGAVSREIDAARKRCGALLARR